MFLLLARQLVNQLVYFPWLGDHRVYYKVDYVEENHSCIFIIIFIEYSRRYGFCSRHFN